MMLCMKFVNNVFTRNTGFKVSKGTLGNSVPRAFFLHKLQIKAVQHCTNGNAE